MNKRKTVYYIDDNPEDVTTTKKYLDDFDVLSHDASDATWMDFVSNRGEYANNPPPDLIVTDANLSPVLSGFDVASYVQLHHLCPFIVICSGTDPDSQRVLQERSYKTDITAFMVKPVTDTKIEAVLERVM